MNKLFIIGNGFDLAHGLPTSYNDFIDDFWRNIYTNYNLEEYKEIVFIKAIIETKEVIEGSNNFDDFKSKLKSHYDRMRCNPFFNETEGILKINEDTNLEEEVFYFKNYFFKQLNIKNSFQNWVDIENEYYRELKNIVKMEKNEDARLKRVKKLNNEFEQVKNLLETYLSENISQKYDFNEFEDRKPYYDIHSIFKPSLTDSHYLNNERIKSFIKEFSFKEDIEEIAGCIKDGERKKYTSYLLSFNYTPTVGAYHYLLSKEKNHKYQYNYIHGYIKDKSNPINFGFGDETDDDYKRIENLNDNEYLKNFKSFQYSQNANYNNLFTFIDSEKFQVCVLGHSCGLSDRVLLNSIFEHKNCRSIKVFYHKKPDGQNNYTDIIQNISRHFNDKKEMRRKIVNKTYCQPLPQRLRFAKKEK